MARMAISAWQGGAVRIRANGEADIRTIRKAGTLPIIGTENTDLCDLFYGEIRGFQHSMVT